MIKQFLKEILKDEYKKYLVHHEMIPSQPAQYSKPDPPLNIDIVNALKSEKITDLYIHQTNAIDIVRSGGNPVSITPTASGKTLTYNIPILEEFLKSEEGHALYLFPLKALEQDQKKKLNALTNEIPNITRLRAAVYDGDTPPAERSKIRANFPRFLLTNPEMLHLAVSQFHKGWSKLLKNLRFVVIDELHTYKGIFGSHMAQLFRRLDRLCAYYGASPQYIASSATISNPVELAENLTGKEFTLVEESGAPTSKRHYIFMNPDESVYTTASKLFRLGMKLGLKTIVFTKARKITETVIQLPPREAVVRQYELEVCELMMYLVVGADQPWDVISEGQCDVDKILSLGRQALEANRGQAVVGEEWFRESVEFRRWVEAGRPKEQSTPSWQDSAGPN